MLPLSTAQIHLWQAAAAMALSSQLQVCSSTLACSVSSRLQSTAAHPSEASHTGTGWLKVMIRSGLCLCNTMICCCCYRRIPRYTNVCATPQMFCIRCADGVLSTSAICHPESLQVPAFIYHHCSITTALCPLLYHLSPLLYHCCHSHDSLA